MGEARVNFRHRALRASDKRVSLPGSTEYATVLCVPRAVAESHVPRGAVWKRTSLLVSRNLENPTTSTTLS